MTGHLPWKGCISTEWLKKTESRLPFPVDDDFVSILQIRVPDELLADPLDPWWLGERDNNTPLPE
jgi:hypothetical protein